MLDDEKTDWLIREIAAKHGVAVGRDDPILILRTLNSKLIHESSAAQQDLLDSFKSELESIAHGWSENARENAERTVNAALAGSKEVMARAVEGSANSLAVAVRRELEDVTAQFLVTLRETQRVATMNMIASAMSIVAAGLALWALLFNAVGIRPG